jgi:tetratricopeptide (TPR) repeat protein
MKLWTVALLLVLAVPLDADVITLRDGTRLEGEVKRTSDGYLVTDPAGKQTIVSATDIQSIELKKSPGSPASAEQALASLRKSVENATDPDTVSKRFEAFIQQHPNTPVAQQAQQDLAQWRQRADQHLIRVGDQWVNKEQMGQMRSRGAEAAAQLLPTLQSAQPADAVRLIDKALAASPGSAALLYLKGVALYKQNQLVPARKAFEAAEQAMPEHAATHNNLAVVLFQTRAQIPGLAEYDKAMLADPQNRQILDNVAEALHSLPGSQANNTVVKKVVAQFQEQDAALQTRMSAQGLHRSGSQWVDEADYQRTQAAQKAAQDKLDSYKSEVTTIQARLMEIEREITYDKQVMAGMMQETSYVDVNTGRVRQDPLPPRYYELQQKVAALAAEQLQKQKQLQQMPRLAAEAQQAAQSQAPYTGKQLIFDERAFPPPSPTTQPTTAPAGAS